MRHNNTLYPSQNPIFVGQNYFLKTIPLSIRYMLISTFAFGCMNALIKFLIHFPTFELVFFRSLSTLFITAFLLHQRGVSFRPNKPALLFIRGVLGVTSMSLFFMGAHYIPIGSAVTIRYIAPLFGGILAVIFLGERLFPLQWVFYFLAFLGVVFIKGFDASVSSLGVFMVVLAAFFSALVYIVLTKIGHQEDSIRVVFYFMLIATLTGLGGSTIENWILPNGLEIILLILLGVFGYFGQLYMTKAFQQGEASSVAPIKYAEVIFTLNFGVFLFQETYTYLSLLGIFLVVGSLTGSVLYKNKREKALQ